MPRQDFRTTRLFVEHALGADVAIRPDRNQTNYLVNVLRLAPGASLLLFNGRDGEWRAEIEEAGRKECLLRVLELERAQTVAPDIWYCFAPIKAQRLDYIVQKAVEMGAGLIQPVITRHTQVSRLNLDRMRANVVEAAEQCGVLAVPETRAETSFDGFLRQCDASRRIVFCDEDAEIRDPVAALAASRNMPLAVLIGPEGGFAEEERRSLLQRDNTLRLSLGPRILRADTAGVAALTLVQAVCGDWRA